MKKMSPEAKEVLDRLAGRESITETLDKLQTGLTPMATQMVEGVIGKNFATPIVGAVLVSLGLDMLRKRVM